MKVPVLVRIKLAWYSLFGGFHHRWTVHELSEQWCYPGRVQVLLDSIYEEIASDDADHVLAWSWFRELETLIYGDPVLVQLRWSMEVEDYT